MNAIESLNHLGATGPGTSQSDPRLSRTFSFSGTVQIDDVAMSKGYSSNYSTSTDYRASVYDNVPDCCFDDGIVKMGEFPQDADYPQGDAVFDENLPSSPGQLRRQAESEDDLSSISSQEEDDIEHIANPGVGLNRDIKNKVLGSVDSGVPSSPVLRSPRYYLHLHMIFFIPKTTPNCCYPPLLMTVKVLFGKLSSTLLGF